MFEMLANADEDTLVDVAYHVGLRFYERYRFANANARRERMIAAFGASVNAELIDTVERVIAEIEHHAGAPLAALSQAAADRYLSTLHDMVTARESMTLGDDSEDVRRRIEQFRREYGLAA